MKTLGFNLLFFIVFCYCQGQNETKKKSNAIRRVNSYYIFNPRFTDFKEKEAFDSSKSEISNSPIKKKNSSENGKFPPYSKIKEEKIPEKKSKSEYSGETSENLIPNNPQEKQKKLFEPVSNKQEDNDLSEKEKIDKKLPLNNDKEKNSDKSSESKKKKPYKPRWNIPPATIINDKRKDVPEYYSSSSSINFNNRKNFILKFIVLMPLLILL